jgi:ABC-type sugar transport system ATPase subunit
MYSLSSTRFGDPASDGTSYEVTDARKEFSGVPVLKGVSVSFAPGEIHTLVGENGAGKSTLLKMMAGIYSSGGGRLHLGGIELPPLTPAVAQSHGIYLVPQEPRLVPDLSVAENLYLGALPKSKLGFTVDWRQTNESARHLLSLVGLDDDPRTSAGALSIAHQQLVECARALAHGCRVIFFDEPTSPLTTHEADKLFDLMNGLRDRQFTLGFISHRFDEVERMSDRITVLRDGVVVAREQRGSVSKESLIESMVGRSVTVTKRSNLANRAGDVVLEITNLVAAPQVNGISLHVCAGEIVGLAGLVGSGRTELSEAVFGLRSASEGTVSLAGKSISGYSPRKCIEAGLVYLAEDRARNGIFADVDLVRNASASIIPVVPTKCGLINDRKELAVAKDALEAMGVKASSMKLPIKSLSGGNQQKVLLARWVLANPTVAIFDEPTRGVDVGAKEGIYEIIETLASNRVGALVISSELEELVRLCDRIYVIYEGEVRGELSGAEINIEAVGALALGAKGARP